MYGIRIGPTELIIIAVIIILLFGVGRIGKLGGEIGRGIREFRQAFKGEEKTEEKKENSSNT